jgi:membrane-associated phospholipid phosphatase
MGFPNWAKNILFLLVFMISGLILAIIIEGLSTGSDLTPLNTLIENWIVPLRLPIMTTLVVWITKFANPFLFLSVTAFISVILIYKHHTFDALLFFATMIIAVVTLTILKNYFQISRPISDITYAEGYSFPSGHATMATAFFFMLAHVFYSRLKMAKNKVILIVGSILGALLVCFSRIYLGAHWTLDVLAGAALGVLAVSFTVLMFSIFIEQNRSLREKLNL